MNQEKEIWKDIPEYEGLYQVSSFGKVKSTLCKKERILKSILSCQGYHQISLYTKGYPKIYFIHRLVMMAFVPNPENKPRVNHLDSNTINNNISNLEWCTRSENIQHGYDFGNMKAPMKGKFGKNHNRSKRIAQYDLKGKHINVFGSIHEAKRITGVNAGNISSACNGRCSDAGGFIWKIIRT